MIKDKTVKYSVILLCAAIMTYVVVRTFTVDITYDEYGSYLYLMHMSVWELFTSKAAWMSANNHVVNTICMQIGNAVFGPELAAMRWGSVVSGLFFLLFGYKFIKEINHNRDWTFLALFIILVSIHFGIEFFSLARGYGMVYAMSMALMYYFRKFINIGEDKYFLYGSITVCFGIFINLTTTILFASWFTTTFLVYLFYFKIGILNYLKKLLRIIPFGLITILIFTKPLSILIAQGEFEYGPAKFTDTLISMYNNTIAKDHLFKVESIFKTGSYLLGLFFVGIIIYSVIKTRNKNSGPYKMNLFFTALFLVITIVINILSHEVTGANYLTARTSILYFPMFAGLLVCFLSDLSSIKFKIIAITFFLILSINNLIFKFKLNHCDEWWFDVNSKEMAEALMEDNGENTPALVTGHVLLLMSPKFYLYKEGFDNIIIENRNIQTESDFTVDPSAVKYILIFNNSTYHLKNKYTIVKKGLVADLVRIEK